MSRVHSLSIFMIRRPARAHQPILDNFQFQRLNSHLSTFESNFPLKSKSQSYSGLIQFPRMDSFQCQQFPRRITIIVILLSFPFWVCMWALLPQICRSHSPPFFLLRGKILTLFHCDLEGHIERLFDSFFIFNAFLFTIFQNIPIFCKTAVSTNSFVGYHWRKRVCSTILGCEYPLSKNGILMTTEAPWEIFG